MYFYYYMKKINKNNREKRRTSLKDNNDEYVSMEFPFRKVKDFLPCQLENHDGYLDKKLVILTWSFFRQGILKQILTEGERLIMTVMPVLSFSEQGTYEVVNNLGSLAARFIFRPIEESGYFYFTQMVQRDKPLSEQSLIKVRESAHVLMNLCSAVTAIGLVIFIFGQSYSSTLLWLYGGSKLTTDLPVLLLRAHCFAVLLLGVNGVTECYMNATADSTTINKNNLIMIYESIAFLGASYLFVICFGPVGFIFGNCFNMLLRIIHSVLFINKRHSCTIHKPLVGLLPKPMFLVSLLLAALFTNLSHAYFLPNEKALHFLIGVLAFIGVLLAWIYEHHELITFGGEKWYKPKNVLKKND